jgi:hypothetical protein
MKRSKPSLHALRDAGTGRFAPPRVEHGIRGITIHGPPVGPAPKWGSEPNPGQPTRKPR